MKVFLFGIALFVIGVLYLHINQEENFMEEQDLKLHFVAQEAAAAAGQYFLPDPFAQGQYVFNQTQGNQAAQFIVEANLHLNDQLQPLQHSYWKGPVTVSIQYFDDSNTTYPYLYEHPSGDFAEVFDSPSVVVTINAGQPVVPMISKNPPNLFRVGAYTWKKRETN